MVFKRKQSSYNRKREYKESKKHILIVCEDSKSAPAYFNFIREKYNLSSTNVKIVGDCDNAAKSVAKAAVEFKKKVKESKVITEPEEYDYIFCIVDVEIPIQSSLNDALNICIGNNLKLILSNPCYEYWLLLHYEKSATNYTSKSPLFSKLKSYYKNYNKKSDCGIFDDIFEHTEDAIKNSKQIKKEKSYGQDLRNCVPSTDIDLVIEILIAQM